MKLKKPHEPVAYGKKRMVTRTLIEEREFNVEPAGEMDEAFADEITLIDFLFQIGIKPNDFDRLEDFSINLSVGYYDDTDFLVVRTAEYTNETDEEMERRVSSEDRALKRYQEDLASYKALLKEEKERLKLIKTMKE